MVSTTAWPRATVAADSSNGASDDWPLSKYRLQSISQRSLFYTHSCYKYCFIMTAEVGKILFPNSAGGGEFITLD